MKKNAFDWPKQRKNICALGGKEQQRLEGWE